MPTPGVSCRVTAGSTGRRAGVLGGFRCFRWSGGRVRDGDDGGGDAGGGAFAAGAGERAGALGLAGAVPVPVDDGAVSCRFPGQCRIAGFPGADRGESRRGGCGRGRSRGAGRAARLGAPSGQGQRRARRRGRRRGSSRSRRPRRRVPAGPGPGCRSGASARPGPAPCRLAFASRSAVSDPSHRHL